MATIAKQPAQVQEVEKARTEHYPEAASQSFKAGQPVYLDGAGKVTACVFNSALIAGFVRQDASGVVDTMIAVAIPRPGVVMEMNVCGAAGASAVTALTNPGTKYEIYIANNMCHVNTAAVTASRVRVIALSKKDTVGDEYGRVLVEVLGTNLQLSGVES